MPRTYVLSWYRPADWAKVLGKPEGRTISDYPSSKYGDVESTARHINSIDPEMDCKVEVFTP